MEAAGVGAVPDNDMNDPSEAADEVLDNPSPVLARGTLVLDMDENSVCAGTVSACATEAAITAALVGAVAAVAEGTADATAGVASAVGDVLRKGAAACSGAGGAAFACRHSRASFEEGKFEIESAVGIFAFAFEVGSGNNGTLTLFSGPFEPL